MLIGEMRDVLLQMLSDAGAGSGTTGLPTPTAFLSTFFTFADIKVEDAAAPDVDGDGLLAQFGTFNFRGPREFSVDLTRQIREGDGEDAPMWQLNCTFHWPPTADTDSLGSGELWSFGKTAEQFRTDVCALPGWSWALQTLENPTDLDISLEQLD